jgi:hypothetical protein
MIMKRRVIGENQSWVIFIRIARLIFDHFARHPKTTGRTFTGGGVFFDKGAINQTSSMLK